MWQGDLQKLLAVHFREIWKGPLDDKTTEHLCNMNTSSNDINNPEHENGNDKYDEDDEDDEDEGENKDLEHREDDEGDN
jgi:hypothetical protein